MVRGLVCWPQQSGRVCLVQLPPHAVGKHAKTDTVTKQSTKGQKPTG